MAGGSVTPWQRARDKATRILRSPAASQRLAAAVAAKTWDYRERLGEEAEQLRLLAAMLRDWALRRYTRVPWATLVTLTGVLVYFLMPLDAVPDFIVALGLVDDLALLARARAWFAADLDAYKTWRREQGLDSD